MSRLRYDACYSARQLAGAPIATSVAIVSLALGIGANTAIFSLINALMLRSLPVHDPQQLVELCTALPDRPVSGHYVYPSVPFRAFEPIRQQNTVFLGVFAFGDQALRNLQVNWGSQCRQTIAE